MLMEWGLKQGLFVQSRFNFNWSSIVTGLLLCRYWDFPQGLALQEEAAEISPAMAREVAMAVGDPLLGTCPLAAEHSANMVRNPVLSSVLSVSWLLFFTKSTSSFKLLTVELH